MKSDVEKQIESRVAAAFQDIIPGAETESGREILKWAQEWVKAVWFGKIYAALPKDKTTVSEYFLDAELEQFLNDAIEESHQHVRLITERTRAKLNS